MGRNIEGVLKGFAAQKCLTLLKLATPRITICRNRRSITARQMRGEIAQLLKSGQASQVYDIKIDSLIREEHTVAAYDLLDHFCNSIISQFPVIETQRMCPPDLKESIATLIYAAPRCAELPELNQVKDMLQTKYGKAFSIAAAELHADCGVNKQIIEMLSISPASEHTKVKKMKEICAQHNVAWKPEWVPGGASVIPPNKFPGASNHARADNRRGSRDEGSVKLQSTEASSSSIRASNLGEDKKVYSHIRSRHEEGSANMSVSDRMQEPFGATAPRFGQQSKPFSQPEVRTRPNMRDSEHMNEQYRAASGSYGQRGSTDFEQEEASGNIRASESPYEPSYKSGFGAKHSSDSDNKPSRISADSRTKIPKEVAAKSNTKISENIQGPAFDSRNSFLPNTDMGASENMYDPYRAGFSPKQDFTPSKEVPFQGHKAPRSTMKASEGTYEPKPHSESHGKYKAADYRKDLHEDTAEFRMQHPDELSDSGSEVFVSVEDDEVGFYSKDELANSNIKAGSMRPPNRETGLIREGSSVKASKETSGNTQESPYDPRKVSAISTEEGTVHKSALKPSEEDDGFASTAKEIAEEAARLAVLNYARRYSQRGSISRNRGDLEEDTTSPIKERVVHAKETIKTNEDDGDRRMYGMAIDRNDKQSSRKVADQHQHYHNQLEKKWYENDKEEEQLLHEAPSNARKKNRDDEKGRKEEEMKRNIQQRHGEKAQFAGRQDPVMVSTGINAPNLATDNHGNSKYDVQGRTAVRKTYKQHQFSEENCNTAATLEKKPIFDDDEEPNFYFDTPRRSESSRDKSNSMRSGPQTRGNYMWEVATGEENRSPIKGNKQKRELHQQDGRKYSENSEEKTHGSTSYIMSKQSALEEDDGEPRGVHHRAMSLVPPKKISQHSRKSTLDETLSAKWLGEDMSATMATQQDNMENLQSLRKSPSKTPEAILHTQHKSQKPAARTKPLPQDSYFEEHDEGETDLLSAYARHGQVDDWVKRVPSNSVYAQEGSMGRRNKLLQKSDGQESSFKHDAEAPQGKYQSEYNSWPEREFPKTKGQTPSTYEPPHNAGGRQERNRSEYDSRQERERPQSQREHQNPTINQIAPISRNEPPIRKPGLLSHDRGQQGNSVSDYNSSPEREQTRHNRSTHQKPSINGGTHRHESVIRKPADDLADPWQKQQNEYDSHPERYMPQNSSDHRTPGLHNSAGPPTRKPPPLPQQNESISSKKQAPDIAEGRQHSVPRHQRKPDEEGMHKPENSDMLHRRSQQPSKPSQHVMSSKPRGDYREGAPKLYTEAPLPPTKQPPSVKPAESSASVGSAAPALQPKLPHVDDIAANLEALRQAKMARLRKPN